MESKALLAVSIHALLRPVARMAIRHGLTAADLQALVRQTLVEVARTEFGLRGRPTSKTRIAALTGLSRAEVARLLQHPFTAEAARVGSRHPLNRLVNSWLHHPPWCSDAGEPRPLPVNGTEPSFASLARTVGADLSHQSLLRELQRLKVAELRGDGVHLLQRAFVPGGSEEADRIPFVGEDGGALLETIDHNLTSPPEARRFERKLVFRALDHDGRQRLAQVVEEEGQRFLESVNARLAPHEHHDDGFGVAGLGLFHFDLPQLPGEPES